MVLQFSVINLRKDTKTMNDIVSIRYVCRTYGSDTGSKKEKSQENVIQPSLSERSWCSTGRKLDLVT